MRVWLLQISEPLPMDGPQVRLLRTAVLAEHLLAKGHEVVWWSGAFDHVNKRHRVRRSMKIPLWDKGELYLLASCGYRKNVSLWRVLDHFQVAREFAKLAPRELPPDIIVASLPSQDFCAAGAEYAAKREIPFIVDVRDQWPDVWLDVFPTVFRPVVRILLGAMFQQSARACRIARGIVGANPALLQWGLKYAQRSSEPWDRVFLLGYRVPRYSEGLLQKSRTFWDSRRIRQQPERLTICFFGTPGPARPLEPVIAAARQLEAERAPVRWILCGEGTAWENPRREAEGLSTVVFPGWLDEVQLQTLMERADIGLAPYHRSENVWGAIPNKIGQYLSAGLPVLSTLVGGLDKLLARYGCGWTYEPMNVNELVGLVREIIRQKDRLPEMRERAKKLFADYFDAEKIYPAYVNYIEEVAQKFRVKRLAA
jgi:glycosyltransferase involved in cell wall biosynthesis